MNQAASPAHFGLFAMCSAQLERQSTFRVRLLFVRERQGEHESIDLVIS